MPRSRVPIRGSIGKSILTGKSSTTIQNTTVVQQVSKSSGGISGGGGVSPTIWSLIQQIPTTVLDVAALSGAGILVFDGSDVIERTLTGTTDVTVTNGTGAAGNPTIDLSTSVKAALALAATAVQPARAVNTGTGLTGGGDLSADRTIALNSSTLSVLGLALTALQPSDFGQLTFITKNDETVFAPNSLQLTAGANVTLDYTTPGEVIINSTGGGGGSGTVTSVAMTVPSILSVSGSPITVSGTLAVTLATQTANRIFAGPASGSAAAPTFRAIVPADLPVASSTAFGAVKVDGTTITAAAGVISAVGGGGGPSPGSPTAKVGSTAVNGSATTYMRSDAAPPIDLAANFTWTGEHSFNNAYTGLGDIPISLNSSNPAQLFANTSAATDTGKWIFNAASNGTFVLYAVNDAESAFSAAFSATRTAGVLKTIDLGNSTDKPVVTINGIPALNITPDTHPATPNTSDDEFEAATLNLTTKWTWRQQNTATEVLRSGSLLIASELNAASVINAIDEALPSGNCVFDIKAGVYVPASGNFSAPIFLQETSTGKAMSLGIFNSGSLFLVSVAGTVSGGWVSNPVANAGAPSYYASSQVLPSPQGYWRVQISGSNLLWFMSSDGLLWWPYGTFALTSFFTTAPDRIGFSVQPGSATAVAQMSVDWIRRIS